MNNKVKLTKDDIKKLAYLSKIELSQEEVEGFTEDMDTILSSVETLDDFENETGCKISDCKFNEIDFDELREDIVEQSITQEQVLANAPNQESGYFKVHGNAVDGENS